MSTKPCDRCEQVDRVEGERYCKRCRAVVLQDIRNQHYEQQRVRTLSSPGTESVGRKMLPPTPGWDDSEARNREP